MIWSEYPEVKLAQRIVKKHSLPLPVKIRSLLELYATVLFESIPITGVDGVAINIKVPGKKPVVIVNQDTTDTRQRFTMAHELGHLVIPWHTGIKIDDGGTSITSEASYSRIETEANRFAAELLMPSTYIRSVADRSDNLAKAQKEICRRLKVSPLAAATHIINTFPAGLIYSVVKNELIIHSRKTVGTSAKLPSQSQMFSDNLYPLAFKKSSCNFNNIAFYWWEIDQNLSAKELHNDTDWRQMLDEIVSLIDSKQDRERYKKSVNGIVALINSRKRNEVDYSLESLLTVCYERFNKEEYSQMRSHYLFDTFLKVRLKEFVERAKGHT